MEDPSLQRQSSQEITSNLSNPLILCLRSGTHQPTNLQKPGTHLFIFSSSCLECERSCRCYSRDAGERQRRHRAGHRRQHHVRDDDADKARFPVIAVPACSVCTHPGHFVPASRDQQPISGEDPTFRKDGASFEKKGSASPRINSSHSCGYDRYCTLCCCIT